MRGAPRPIPKPISRQQARENICWKVCQEFINDAKKLDLKILIRDKNGYEVKEHPFLDILNKGA